MGWALARASAWAAAFALAACGLAAAQDASGGNDAGKNAAALRSVAVLEYTGDVAHPTASRLVPVSVYDGQQIQDGGIYLARPQPLALDSETEYELQKDGKNVGFYDLTDASNAASGWVGLGKYRPLPKSPTPEELAAAAAKQKVDEDDADSDTPVLHRKHHDDDQSAAKAPAPDPDRPRLTEDEDTSKPAADPDRPKLQNPADDVARVEDLPAVSDPNRPRLMRGVPASDGPAVKPRLIGIPPEMNQMVAISDPRPIKEHSWDFTWANPGDEAKMKAELEDMARKELGLEPPPAPVAKPKRVTASTRHKAAPPPAPPAPLLDEKFRVFELQYGAGATLVLSAHTAGSGADEKFVTLIAQPDLYGNLAVFFKNVTDGAHLDFNPRMRLVDAVDALNDNRGELLFELRGQTERQFALYRVLRGQVTKIFSTEPSYWGTAAN